MQAIKGYDHFGSESCPMFDQSEIDLWNARMAGQGMYVSACGARGN